MSSPHLDTLRELEKHAKRTPEICVAYSGGKDSLAVLDLCAKTFPTVRAWFKFTIPELDVEQDAMRYAKTRYGVEAAQFPKLSVYEWLKLGIFCDAKNVLWEFDDKLPLKYSFAYGMAITGCDLCATGMKDADGLKRRQFFANIRDGEDPFWSKVIHPIRRWRKRDVMTYLALNKIETPKTSTVNGAVTSGVGIDHASLCWLHDNHYPDFCRLEKWFPYIRASIKRREWFGVVADGDSLTTHEPKP